MVTDITTKIYSELDAKLHSAWNQYLEQNDESCFYQLIEWQYINSNYFGHKIYCVTAEEDKNIVGVLPLVSLKSILFGHILSSMPYVNYGSSCSNDCEIENELISTASNIARDNSVDYMELRSIRPSTAGLKETTNKISLTIELDKDYQVLWDGYKSKHRTNIRRVYKHGVTVKQGGGELLPEFYYILSKSWKSLGTPIYSIKYFEQIFKYLSDYIKIFVVYKDDVPIAVALNGYYKNTVEGMWLGVDQNYRGLQPSYVLYWEMIKHACQNGYNTFHLGRSSVDSGGESFKKKWNAEIKQLYWQYYLNKKEEIPSLNPSNPKYKYFIKTWSKMPLRATQILGPLISKYIP